MKIDRYTKVILTIIAACLVWMSLGGPSLITTANAASPSVVYVAGLWDLDNRPQNFYEHGKRSDVAMPVRVIPADKAPTDK
jgi:hypothetical protein